MDGLLLDGPQRVICTWERLPAGFQPVICSASPSLPSIELRTTYGVESVVRSVSSLASGDGWSSAHGSTAQEPLSHVLTPNLGNTHAFKTTHATNNVMINNSPDIVVLQQFRDTSAVLPATTERRDRRLGPIAACGCAATLDSPSTRQNSLCPVNVYR